MTLADAINDMTEKFNAWFVGGSDQDFAAYDQAKVFVVKQMKLCNLRTVRIGRQLYRRTRNTINEEFFMNQSIIDASTIEISMEPYP